MEVFKFALVLRLVSTLSYETSFQIRPVQIKYVYKSKIKGKEFPLFLCKLYICNNNNNNNNNDNNNNSNSNGKKTRQI